jgi:hypothetical protein
LPFQQFDFEKKKQSPKNGGFPLDFFSFKKMSFPKMAPAFTPGGAQGH